MRNLEFGIWNEVWGMRDEEFGIWNLEMRNLELGISLFQIPNS